LLAGASSATPSRTSPAPAISPRPTNLDYYGHAYAQPDFLGNNQTVSGSWRTGRFIAQLAHQVL
jgi:hypothetical protein